LSARRRLVVEQEQPPLLAVDRAFGHHIRPRIDQDASRARADVVLHLPVERREVGAAVAATALGLGARGGRQGGQRVIFPVGARCEDHDLVLVEHQHFARQVAPLLLDRLEIDLDGSDTADFAAPGQGV